MSGTDAGNGSIGVVALAICLRACYALSGTDIAQGALFLHAMFSTARRYPGLVQRVIVSACMLTTMAGTDTTYGAIRARAAHSS
eukprot:2848179-Rhodomonas_salina.4